MYPKTMICNTLTVVRNLDQCNSYVKVALGSFLGNRNVGVIRV